MRTYQSYVAGRHGVCWSGRRHQKGAIAVIAAIWVLIAMVVLGGIDIGNLYFQKRDAQRIADMAALAAVQPMSSDPNPNNAPNDCLTAARANVMVSANNNDKSGQFALIAGTDTPNPTAGNDQIAVTCGRWDPIAYVTPAPSAANAAQVTVYRKVNYFFLGLLNSLSGREAIIKASATARATNVDSFSVSAGLLSVGSDCSQGQADWTSNGLLNILLSSLLGTGSTLNLTVGCYGALASSNIKLGDLASFMISDGTPSGLVNQQFTVLNLLKASQKALTKNATANVNLTAAQAALSIIVDNLNATVANTPVTIINPNQGQNPPTSAVIQLSVPSGQNSTSVANGAALANVDLFDLVMSALTLANSSTQSAATVKLTAAQLGKFGFPSNVGLQMQILSPPSQAIGEAGKVDGKYRTQATNAQIGVSLQIGLPDIPILGALGLPLATIQGLNVPLYLLVGGPATANLESIDCEESTSQKPSQVTISVTPSIANLCVGNAPTTPSGWLNMSSNQGCSGTATSVSVSALGVPVVALPISSSGPLLTLGAGSWQNSSGPAFYSTTASPPRFCVESDAPANCPSYWTTNSNVLSPQILHLNALSVGPLVVLSILNIPIQPVTNAVAAVLQPVLNAVVPLLNSLLVPLLNLLGAQIGQATVHQIGLTCGTPQLVNN